MNKLKAIVAGGLIGGVLDIVYAFVVYGPLSYKLSPEDVLHSVAAGWMGRDAANAGGLNTALIGLATHFMIAIVMAAVFVAVLGASARARPLLWGVLYGLVLYVVMNYVVVPLSARHESQHFAASAPEAIARLKDAFSALRPKDPVMLAGTILTHTAFVGVPIALANRRYNA